jgi:hypothetical protein
MLVFNRHCAVLAICLVYQTGAERGDRIRYAPPSICRSSGGDYRERLTGEA